MQVHLGSFHLPAPHESMLVDATHIFDGLNNFPTHVAHMHLGTFLAQPTPWPITPDVLSKAVTVDLGPSPTLYALALQWLREDRERRRELEKQGRKKRGAKTAEVCIRAARSPCVEFDHVSGRCPRTLRRSTGSACARRWTDAQLIDYLYICRYDYSH